MAKLYYKYGAMGSSKTANALMTRFNYMEKGATVWLIKPETDTRDDYNDENGNRVTVVKSRIGLSAVADVIKQSENICNALAVKKKTSVVDAIICDECQFLTEEQVEQLKYIAEYDDIPVLCFGLRSDFRTKLFPGSARLFELADSISEVKSVCKCGKKAIVNARFGSDGQVVTEGAQVEIGGNEKYESMCWKCWQELIEKGKTRK